MFGWFVKGFRRLFSLGPHINVAELHMTKDAQDTDAAQEWLRSTYGLPIRELRANDRAKLAEPFPAVKPSLKLISTPPKPARTPRPPQRPTGRSARSPLNERRAQSHGYGAWRSQAEEEPTSWPAITGYEEAPAPPTHRSGGGGDFGGGGATSSWGSDATPDIPDAPRASDD